MSEITPEDFKALAARVDHLERHMKTNMAKIDNIERNTKSIVETFEALQGGFRVLQGIGRFAKPIGYIAAMIAACIGAYKAIKTGLWP